MRLVWLTRARHDLAHAMAYIARDNPRAAQIVGARIVKAVERLRNFPEVGRPGRVAGTRELVIMRTRYIVAYQISGDEVQILAVIHSSRRWPKSF